MLAIALALSLLVGCGGTDTDEITAPDSGWVATWTELEDTGARRGPWW